MTTPEKSVPSLKKADYTARCWVQGAKKFRFKDGTERWEPIVTNFHDRFLDHPWVREAIAEGWDRELRGHIVFQVRMHVFGGGQTHTLHINDLMPPKEWIATAKREATRYRIAAEWRARITSEHGSIDAWFKKVRGRMSDNPPARPSHIVGMTNFAGSTA